MRDIEFRAKHTYDGQWKYGYLVYVPADAAYKITQGKEISYFVQGTSIGQYTGLKDKNGIKIFEGYILNSLYKDDGCTGVYVIDFIDGCFYPKKYKAHQQPVTITMRDLRMCEVIGNIYDNPELLEVNDD